MDKKKDCKQNKIMDELLDSVIEAYEKAAISNKHGALKMAAAELCVSPIKVRKLLITAGLRDSKEYYSNDRSRRILSLYKDGKTVSEIMKATGLNRASVCGYLPYSKCVYNTAEVSTTAERIRLYRMRKKRCEHFVLGIQMMTKEESEKYLWDLLELLEGCFFKKSINTGECLYKYKLEEGKMLIGKNRKPIEKRTIMVAFAMNREIQKQKGYVTRQDLIGVLGSEYLFPIFQRIGICDLSGEDA